MNSPLFKNVQVGDKFSVKEKYAWKNVKLHSGKQIWLEYYLELTHTYEMPVNHYFTAKYNETVNITEEDLLIFKLAHDIENISRH